MIVGVATGAVAGSPFAGAYDLPVTYGRSSTQPLQRALVYSQQTL